MHSRSCWTASLWCNSSYSSAKYWVLWVLWWTLGLYPKIQEWRTLWDSDETIWVGPWFELWHPWVSATAIVPAWFRDGCACRTASNWWPHTRDKVVIPRPQDPQVPEIAPTAPEVVDPANSGCFELLPQSPDFKWTASFSETLQVPCWHVEF
jgi:hypothetical protein